jgi:hypothetical protein
MPPSDDPQNLVTALRNAAGVVLPSHISHRLDSILDANTITFLDVAIIKNGEDAVDVDSVVVTDRLVVNGGGQGLKLWARESDEATTTLTIRALSDVRQISVAGSDQLWVREPLRDPHPSIGAYTLTFQHGEPVTFPLTFRAQHDAAHALRRIIDQLGQ